MKQNRWILLKALLPVLVLLSLVMSCDGKGCDTERQLDFDDPDVEIKTAYINSSMYLFAKSKQFIIFEEEKVVLRIYFDNTTYPFAVEAEFHVFAKDEDPDRIEGWINNQYSDHIDINPAEPISEVPLPADHITITDATHMGRETGSSGHLFDRYFVAYRVDAYTVDGLLSLSAFNHEVYVYLRID